MVQCPAESAPLPPAVLVALRSIAADMQNIPCDCIVDRAELLMWLRRMARRVEGIQAMRVYLGFKPEVRPARASRTAISPRNAAEAVFSGKSQPTAQKTAARTVVSRKGTPVRVEVRNRQLEMPV